MQLSIQLNPGMALIELFGAGDRYLKLVRDCLDVKIVARNTSVIIEGDERNVKKAAEVLGKMESHLLTNSSLTGEQVTLMLAEEHALPPEDKGVIAVFAGKKVIRPLTKGQQKYVQIMLKNDLTFCTGPAGTGKTYLAVAVAVSMLKKKQIRRIVLARPAVEAGEKLGFLPGDLQAKVNPYLRPLFDALEDTMSFAQMKKFMELDIIEVIPLAFMRGRTLNEAVIICDEAQNTLPLQMLMVLTRLGHGSKMIITGDITQIDLDRGQKSGMVEAIEILRKVRGIAAIELGRGDIVRHRLVQNIVRAYKLRKK